MNHITATSKTVLWGRLPHRDTKPVLTVPSGSRVVFDTLSHEGVMEDQGRNPVAFFGRYGIEPDEVLADAVDVAANAKIPHDFDDDGPHIILGPVAVEDALPGDVLKVEILSLVPRVPYGIITNRHGKGALAGEFPENAGRLADASPAYPDRYGSAFHLARLQKISGQFHAVMNDDGREITFPLRPFLGTMGVAPGVDTHANSIPPLAIGGNIDINELYAGATLYLPIEAPGALFFAGDPHLAQGDGEIALSAVEGSLRAELRLTVLKKGAPEIPAGGALPGFFAENEKYWILAGLDPDLDDAVKAASRAAIAFLARHFAVDRQFALAYLSAAADFEISQVVDRTKGVHALIPKAHFAAFIQPRLRAGLRDFTLTWFGGGLFAPIQPLCEALSLPYAELGGQINIQAPNGKIAMKTLCSHFLVDGYPLAMPFSPLPGEGGVLVPVGALREVMGLEVNWSTEGDVVLGRVEVPVANPGA